MRNDAKRDMCKSLLSRRDARIVPTTASARDEQSTARDTQRYSRNAKQNPPSTSTFQASTAQASRRPDRQRRGTLSGFPGTAHRGGNGLAFGAAGVPTRRPGPGRRQAARPRPYRFPTYSVGIGPGGSGRQGFAAHGAKSGSHRRGAACHLPTADCSAARLGWPSLKLHTGLDELPHTRAGPIEHSVLSITEQVFIASPSRGQQLLQAADIVMNVVSEVPPVRK